MAELPSFCQGSDGRHLDNESHNGSEVEVEIPIINQTNFAVTHVNIRSLNKNFEDFKQLYENDAESKFDIIGISETWNVLNPDLFSIPKYKLELNCRVNERGGGVGAYINSSLDYTRLDDINIHNAESLWLRVNIKKVLIIGIVYRKPSGDINEFINDMSIVLEKIKIDKHSIVILGDFNINLLARDEKSFALISMMECYGVHQLITMPTRVTKSSKSLIDHIYTNIDGNTLQAGCIEVDVSDHFPVYVLFDKLNIHASQHKKILRRNFKHFQAQLFRYDLMNTNWEDVYKCDNPNEAYRNFVGIFNSVCEKHAPLQLSCIKDKRAKNPWITPSIKTQIRKKHKLFMKALKSNHDTEILVYDEYKNIGTISQIY